MNPVWLNSYPSAVNRAPAVSATESLADLIRQSCRRFVDCEAFWSMGFSITFGETYELAQCVAGWLGSQRLAAGERVAIMLPNVLAFPVVTYGVLLAGCVVVNVNPGYTPRELIHQLKDSGARTVFVWEPALWVIEKALEEILIDQIVTVSPKALLASTAIVSTLFPQGSNPSWQSFEMVLALGALCDIPPCPAYPARSTFLQYTGGTTGVSKGAVLTEGNVLAALAQQVAWMGPFLSAESGPHRIITALPLYHIASLMAAMLRQLVHGGCCILIAYPRNLDELVETMSTQRFTVMRGVNTLYNALLNHPRIREVDFSHCLFSTGGAAATQQVVVDRWRALTGMSIVEGYGLTETCCYVSQQALDGREFNGSVGLPLPLTELSIRDAFDRELPLGEVGEICVRGPQVMARYWNNQDETAKVMTPDGFLRTGDIGAVDTGGYLRLSDRKKDMILVSGFNVFPNEIEGVILQHPKVLEVAVIAISDPRSGEVPAAFVVKSDPSLTAAELGAFCEEQLAAYKRPKRIEFRDALPKTAVGKILRYALRDEIWHLPAHPKNPAILP